MQTLQDLRIIFMGTPEFAVVSLQRLLEARARVEAVVTVPDRPAGRGRKLAASAVKNFATSIGLPVYQPENFQEPSFLRVLQQHRAEIFVVVAFRILPRSVFSLPKLGTVNAHGSLLPKYRGAAPIQWAVINGERETGITTFLIDDKVDTGNLLLQRVTPIDANETAGELHDRLAVLGAELLIETLNGLAQGTLTPQPQQGEPTRAPKITKEMARIDWQRPAKQLHNFIRGMSPVPAAFALWQNKKLRIFRSSLQAASHAASPAGTVLQMDRRNGRFEIATGDGTLAILELQLEGKKRMPVTEFLQGSELRVGERLR